MSRRSHHRSRSSIDRVLDLLGDLDESQVELLLREAESTVSGNIPVSQGIDFFTRPGITPTSAGAQTPPSSPPRRKFLTSLSPRKQTELRRRLSKRTATQQEISAGSSGHHSAQSPKKTHRSYKRISRPVFSAAAATTDLIELLAAYLLDARVIPDSSASSTALSSPTTPRSIFSPYPQREIEGPELDLLEPSPMSIFGNPMREPSRNISGIFEVLDDAAPIGPRR
ncbi:hypothetical protein GGR50DRAFT_75978 [Xylaria sp. CBS 124048]|nr:hypothetical protein GGR50DRAFT_75978 [Xylaria sp. CBS 124048]